MNRIKLIHWRMLAFIFAASGTLAAPPAPQATQVKPVEPTQTSPAPQATQVKPVESTQINPDQLKEFQSRVENQKYDARDMLTNIPPPDHIETSPQGAKFENLNGGSPFPSPPGPTPLDNPAGDAPTYKEMNRRTESVSPTEATPMAD